MEEKFRDPERLEDEDVDELVDRLMADSIHKRAADVTREALKDDPVTWSAFKWIDLDGMAGSGQPKEDVAKRLGLTEAEIEERLHKARTHYRTDVHASIALGCFNEKQFREEVAWYKDRLDRGVMPLLF